MLFWEPEESDVTMPTGGASRNAEVVAILGRTPESVQRSADRLKEQYGFAGGCYTDLPTLLREARPAIVDICTPPAVHATQARQALEAGCHVLCEKPLVFGSALTSEEMLQQAREVTQMAVARGARFGLCSQFSVVARTCYDLLQAHEPGDLLKLAVELRSPVRGRTPDPVQTWVDLGPHLVAVLQTLVPGAEPEWPEVRATTDEHEARFDFRCRSGRGIADVQFVVRLHHGRTRQRAPCVLNHPFDLIGEELPDGHFRRYRSGTGSMNRAVIRCAC